VEENMKVNKVVPLIGLVLVVVLITSCTQPISTIENPNLSPTFVLGGATLVPTSTPTISPTPTVFPTLSAEEARIRLLALLANNGNCHLPCLWGLTPGKSSSRDAQAILVPISTLSGFTSFKPGIGSISPEYTDDNINIYSKLGFLAEPDNYIISRISFRVEAHKKILDGGYEKVFGSTLFGERVKIYQIPSILSEQGVPDSVLIGTLAGHFRDGGSWGFHILLLYPKRGLLVDYTTQMQLVDENILGCPSNAHVEFEIYPSGEEDLFFKHLESTNWPQNIKSNYKSLEDVTSMTRNDFYETFRQPTDKCIETPANLWPTPEP
jgi:hypothetical protein